jgi:hypothetical protein
VEVEVGATTEVAVVVETEIEREATAEGVVEVAGVMVAAAADMAEAAEVRGATVAVATVPGNLLALALDPDLLAAQDRGRKRRDFVVYIGI